MDKDPTPQSGDEKPTTTLTPGAKPPSLSSEFLKRMSEWFFEIFEIETVGDDVNAHAENLKHKSRVLRFVVIWAFIFACIGFTLRGCYDVTPLEENNRTLVSALATNQAALNSERAENDKLIHQHNDDLGQISFLRQSMAGHFPPTITPAQIMGFHDETNFVISTNISD